MTTPFKTAYAFKPRVQLTCSTKGRTKQSFKDECDINVILRRFLKTGVFDFTNKHEPRYGDTTGLEYTQAMQTVAAAKSLFLDLPAALRARFENEPAKFLDFVNDEKNRAEAIELGLIKKPVAPPATVTAAPSPAPEPVSATGPVSGTAGT